MAEKPASILSAPAKMLQKRRMKWEKEREREETGNSHDGVANTKFNLEKKTFKLLLRLAAVCAAAPLPPPQTPCRAAATNLRPTLVVRSLRSTTCRTRRRKLSEERKKDRKSTRRQQKPQQF